MGALDSTRAFDGELVANTGNIYIGNSPWYGAAKGAYAGVYFYKKALTTEEVTGLYRLGAAVGN